MAHESSGLDHHQVERIRQIAASHGVRRVQLYGSRATGRARLDSDVDLLIELAPGRDLIDLIGFKQDVEDALGCPADVVTPAGLSPFLRDRILAQARPL